MSVDKSVQGVRGTALDALIVGHNVLEAVVRELGSIIEDVEVISDTGDGTYMYDSMNQDGIRLTSAASLKKNFHARMQ